jgi:hypothetical protein
MAPVKNIRELAMQAMDEYKTEFGPPTVKQQMRGLYVGAKARYTGLKYALLGDIEQHKTVYTQYRALS